METLRFFNPYEEIRYTENLLPHWQQKGAVYFVTFRLGDAIPAHLRAEWKDEREVWLRLHPEPWNAETEQEYHRRFSSAIERWLDAGHGSCVLGQIECARIVDDALSPFRWATACADLFGRYVESCPCPLGSESRTSPGRFASKLENVHCAIHQSITGTFWNFLATKLF